MPYVRSISRPIYTRRRKDVRKIQRYNRRRILGGFYNPFYANDTTAYRPEMWAQESIRVLVESMVFAGTVHRDFDPEVASYGEIVHTRKPSEFVAERKQNDLDTLNTQDASATKIEVRLNQRVYVSFVLGDGERSKSFMDLIQIFLVPAMQAQARFLDRALAVQAYQFLTNTAGGLGTLTKTNSHDYLLDAREVMNSNKVGSEGRWLALASRSETEMQKTEMFKKANEVGDDGTALERAILGVKAGWNTFLELNTPSVRAATTSGTTTTLSAFAAGTTVIDLAVGGVAAAGIGKGDYITIAGDMTPLRVTAISTDQITVSRGLREAVASGAVVTAYDNALVDQAAAIPAGDTTDAVTDGYPEGWMKAIAYDGTGVPKEGQLVSFVDSTGTTLYSAEYGIVHVTSDGIVLDRPLEDTLDDNAIINLGPSGDYNFGYQRNALTLVNRPLELPEAGTGARAAQAILNNMAMRVVLTYDGATEGTRVTAAALFGHKVLDVNRGVVLLG